MFVSLSGQTVLLKFVCKGINTICKVKSICGQEIMSPRQFEISVKFVYVIFDTTKPNVLLYTEVGVSSCLLIFNNPISNDMCASSKSLHFILSLRLYSSFITVGLGFVNSLDLR